MKKSKLTKREYFLLAFLAVFLIGVAYYMFYLTPLQNKISAVKNETADLDSEITTASVKVGSMNSMQAELDEIFANADGEVTEIAPYDNAKVVLNQLNAILSKCIKYDLSFKSPQISSDGTVRREVSMRFDCPSYHTAKQIFNELTTGHWRCIMTDLSMDGKGDLEQSDVSCSATITFFERVQDQ